MKRKYIIHIVLLSLALLLLLGMLLFGLLLYQIGFFGYDWFRHSTLEGEELPMGEYALRNITDIEINCFSGNGGAFVGKATPVKRTGFRIHAEDPRNAYHTECRKNGSKLIVNCRPKRFSLFSLRSEIVLSIETPDGWEGKSIRINTLAGAGRIQGVKVQKTDICSAFGSCDVRDVTSETTEIKTLTGEIRFKGFTENLDCVTLKGNTLLHMVPPKRADREQNLSLISLGGELVCWLDKAMRIELNTENLMHKIGGDFLLQDNGGVFPNHRYSCYQPKDKGEFLNPIGSVNMDIAGLKNDILLRKS